ncbi:hypothetical protein HanIR_Chr14g0704571 [Helianthus annuus]|nr:hypothetical protein HanIR_Chr14g0704571 [Helianthus annuus]
MVYTTSTFKYSFYYKPSYIPIQISVRFSIVRFKCLRRNYIEEQLENNGYVLKTPRLSKALTSSLLMEWIFSLQ